MPFQFEKEKESTKPKIPFQKKEKTVKETPILRGLSGSQKKEISPVRSKSPVNSSPLYGKTSQAKAEMKVKEDSMKGYNMKASIPILEAKIGEKQGESVKLKPSPEKAVVQEGQNTSSVPQLEPQNEKIKGSERAGKSPVRIPAIEEKPLVSTSTAGARKGESAAKMKNPKSPKKKTPVKENLKSSEVRKEDLTFSREEIAREVRERTSLSLSRSSLKRSSTFLHDGLKNPRDSISGQSEAESKGTGGLGPNASLKERVLALRNRASNLKKSSVPLAVAKAAPLPLQVREKKSPSKALPAPSPPQKVIRNNVSTPPSLKKERFQSSPQLKQRGGSAGPPLSPVMNREASSKGPRSELSLKRVAEGQENVPLVSPLADRSRWKP